MTGLLRAPLLITLSLLFFCGVMVSDVSAQAKNPPATALPAENSPPLATKGDVMYWQEQCQDYGTDKTVKEQAPGGGGLIDRKMCELKLGGASMSCLLDSPGSSRCDITYSNGHVRRLTTTALNASGATDTIYNGNGFEEKDVIQRTDGTFLGPKDENGEPVTEPGEPGKCGITDVLCAIGKIPGILVSGIAYLLLVLSSLILWVAGSVFNWVMIRTVFQFATYFGTSEGMLVAWGVMRDIANIGLLFGFIFMGVATILNTQSMEGYSAKKALPRLIIFAVLLNFSLFATQGIIDVANGFASVFSSYAGEKCDTRTSDAGGDSSEKCANVGISGKIAAAAGMNKLPTVGEAWDGATNMLERPYTTATMLIILSVLVTITAVVLFAAAIMLVIRVVVLSLLMVTSPIGFAGMAIPALQGISKDWWHQLINQSFFAPLYLLMVFISLKLVDGLQTGNASVADAITGNTSVGGTTAGNMQVLVVYAVVIGFMVASLMIAKKMGAAGAGFATNAASAVVYGSLARGANFAAGGATRGLLAGSRIAQKGVQRYAPNSKLANSIALNTNRAANVLHRTTASANLDVRRAGVGGILGLAGATSGTKPAEHATYADTTHMATDFREGKLRKQLIAQADSDEQKHQLNSLHDDDPLPPELESVLTSMSVKELEQLHGIKAGVEGLAKNLTPEQFSKLMDKDSSLTAGEKGALQSARFAELKREADGIVDPATGVRNPPNPAAIKKILGNLGKSDLENLPADLLASPNIMSNLSSKQREDLAGSNRRTAVERQKMKESSKSGVFEAKFNDPASAGYPTVYDFVTSPTDGIRTLSAQDILKLPASILISDEVTAELTPAMLEALQDDNKLSAGDISEIGRKIRSTTASTSHGYLTSGAGIAYWS